MDDISHLPKKDQAVIILKKMEEVIVKCINENRDQDYTAFDLVYICVQEMAQMAAEIQAMDKLFDEDDNGKDAKGKA